MTPNDVDQMYRAPDGTSATFDMGPPQSVEGTFIVINPAAGQGFPGVTVTGPAGESVTNASGQATVSVPEGPYRVALDVAGARTHEVWGVAHGPFQQITYLSTDMITGFVFSSLGLADNPEKGILVVGLDTPTLAPAVGAEATIDAASDTPFIFAGIQPAAGQTIPEGGQGFVTFPNVEPGTVRVTTAYPNGACQVFPAETELQDVDVTAGHVTVIAFTCRVSEADPSAE